ncbi:concanavalin A-like lectin/glucanase domain-containing protein [Cantharellus anzutake]|uniref:concanavalin A-like lectin/glucanase domain-containing protein n=1 Tax=Cantharellus anzutake TaxID=1750568 RepID=UPI001903E64E|nr:concanavalin A-like lectin/glucanase domain-containing protein [Cantharellus anzutake]KAF8336553.1 concanavalin A-like lectin/glucanase domain-containing protein [Cantharellus anzutake]
MCPKLWEMRVLAFMFSGLFLHAIRAQVKSYIIANNYSGSTLQYSERYEVLRAGTSLRESTIQIGGFLSATDAKVQNITYVNEANNAIIRVDNITVGTTEVFNRATVKMSTQATINKGSLILFQARHMPYGCSLWPGLWTLGGNSSNWPQYGEIDIVENVNLATNNQYSLHTIQGCNRPPYPIGNETGWIVQSSCWNMTNDNEGCIVIENKANNYGQGFALNGGGAYAVLWDDEGIRFWFFPQLSIPPDLPSTSPNPGNWGPPSAFYPQSTCNTTLYFGPQTIILQTLVCGLYAGAPEVFNSGGLCKGSCSDLVRDPRNYDQAYFEIEFLRVFVDFDNITFINDFNDLING